MIWRAPLVLNDRENILSALGEKPLTVYQIMRRANVANAEACQALLLKMRDEGLVISISIRDDGSSAIRKIAAPPGADHRRFAACGHCIRIRLVLVTDVRDGYQNAKNSTSANVVRSTPLSGPQ